MVEQGRKSQGTGGWQVEWGSLDDVFQLMQMVRVNKRDIGAGMQSFRITALCYPISLSVVPQTRHKAAHFNICIKSSLSQGYPLVRTLAET